MNPFQEIKHILCFVTKNRSYKSENAKTNSKKLTDKNKLNPEGLMIHSAGVAQPSADVFIRQYDNEKRGDSVHGFIDGETGLFYQFLPWNNKAWHCGGGGNSTHIGVELCEPKTIEYPKKDSEGIRRYADGTRGSSTKWKETNKKHNGYTTEDVVRRTYQSAVELFAFLCKFYELDPLNEQPIEEIPLGQTLICKDKTPISKTSLKKIPLGKERLEKTPIDKDQMLDRMEEIQKDLELNDTPSREELSLLLDKTKLGEINIGKKGKKETKLGEVSLGKILSGKDIIVISHKWGYFLNVASNHGDPDHLWAEFGLTLQKFREDIKETMGSIEYIISAYPIDTCIEMSEYSKQLQKKLEGKGIETTVIRAGGLKLGPYKTKEEAETRLAEMRGEQDPGKIKLDGFITWKLNSFTPMRGE
ncbi:MAG: N-acetylmuramoyl-L-alanine amidase [Methanimicrococcus sp.]|nr:N-acetylmuramoyl-L-alanine amidase [Methanimicrococcus sp.]